MGVPVNGCHSSSTREPFLSAYVWSSWDLDSYICPVSLSLPWCAPFFLSFCFPFFAQSERKIYQDNSLEWGCIREWLAISCCFSWLLNLSLIRTARQVCVCSSLTFTVKVFRCCMCCLEKGALCLFLFPSVYFEQTGKRRLLLSLTEAKFSSSRLLGSCQSWQRHILSSNVSLNRSSIMLLLFLFTIIVRLGKRAVAGEDDEGEEEEEERKKRSKTHRNSEKKVLQLFQKKSFSSGSECTNKVNIKNIIDTPLARFLFSNRVHKNCINIDQIEQRTKRKATETQTDGGRLCIALQHVSSCSRETMD